MKTNIKFFPKVLLFVLISFFLFFVSLIWVEEDIYVPSVFRGKKISFNCSETLSGQEFLDINSYPIKAEEDTYIVSAGFNAKTVILSVKELGKEVTGKIEYQNLNGEWDTEHPVYLKMHTGRVFAHIPSDNNGTFRIQLTNLENTDFSENQITVIENYVASPEFWIIFSVLEFIWLFLLIDFFNRRIVLSIIQKARVSLSEKKFYACLLLILILLTEIVVYGKIVVSGYDYMYYDIGGGDEPEAYIPIFVYMIRKIRTLDFHMWTFTNGIGTSTIAYYSYFFNPFLLFVFLVGSIFGIQTIDTSLLIAQLANIICCGLLCYSYLDNFKGSYRAKAIASYICSFCGFIILYEQHYVHMDFLFDVLVTLLIIENILKNKKFSRHYLIFTLWCAILFLRGVYIAYMIGLFAAFYTIIRLIQRYHSRELVKALKIIAMFAVSTVAGILISMPLLLPTINDLLVNSSRITGSELSLTEKIQSYMVNLYPLRAVLTITHRLLSNNIDGTGNNFKGLTGTDVQDYYVAPELFFSLFIISFIAIYFLTLRKREKERKQRVIRVACGFLCAFIIYIPLGSAVFNAMVAPFGRYSFVLMPVFAAVSACALDELPHLSRREMIFTLLVSAGVLILLVAHYILPGEVERRLSWKLFMILEIMLMTFFIMLLAFPACRNSKYMIPAFGCLIIINMMSDSYLTVNDRVFCIFSDDLLNQDDNATQNALQFVEDQDESMYRLEKDYYDLIYYHDAYFQDYQGISTYNSTINRNVQEFYDLYCNSAINFYGQGGFWYSFMSVSHDSIQNALLGIRYILTQGGCYPDDVYQEIYDKDGVQVVKNKEAKSFATFYDKAITAEEADGAASELKQDILSSAVILEDESKIREGTDINIDEIENERQSRVLRDSKTLPLTEWISADENTQITFDDSGLTAVSSDPENEKTSIIMDLSGIQQTSSETTYLKITSSMPHSEKITVLEDTGSGMNQIYLLRGNDLTEYVSAKIVLDDHVKSLQLIGSGVKMQLMNIQVVSESQNLLPDDTIPEVKMINDSHLEGTLATDRTGYLFLPIPYENGWQMMIDGQKAEILQADKGFMAVAVEAGQHEFKLTYCYPYFKLGVFGCFTGIFLWIAEFFILRRQKRKYKMPLNYYE